MVTKLQHNDTLPIVGITTIYLSHTLVSQHTSRIFELDLEKAASKWERKTKHKHSKWQRSPGAVGARCRHPGAAITP